MQPIRQRTRAYESWLREQLGGDIVASDLRRKHEKMRDSPFSFLRASYWRWAETVLAACPDLEKAPRVLAVGDIHLENFGTWRDEEGRLIWGVNDFDEAAEMPYALDLVRLATSTLLARAEHATPAAPIAGALLRGYRKGLAAPCPIVLDRKYRWLRRLVEVSDELRKDFWKKTDGEKQARAPVRYRKLLAASMPQRGLSFWTARRTAGTGSLGRPRWIAVADWNGGEVVREAKAVVPSAWSHVHGGSGEIRCGEIAGGRYRAADPWYDLADNIVVRRLSPNNRKIEADDAALVALPSRLLQAMGRELANVHLGVRDRRDAILKDLDGRPTDWLAACTDAMADATRRDFAAFGGRRR